MQPGASSRLIDKWEPVIDCIPNLGRHNLDDLAGSLIRKPMGVINRSKNSLMSLKTLYMSSFHQVRKHLGSHPGQGM